MEANERSPGLPGASSPVAICLSSLNCSFRSRCECDSGMAMLEQPLSNYVTLGKSLGASSAGAQQWGPRPDVKPADSRSRVGVWELGSVPHSTVEDGLAEARLGDRHARVQLSSFGCQPSTFFLCNNDHYAYCRGLSGGLNGNIYVKPIFGTKVPNNGFSSSISSSCYFNPGLLSSDWQVGFSISLF